MPPPDTSEHPTSFDKVVTWSAAFSIAAAAGFLASVRQVHPSVEFRFSFATVAAFFAAGICTFTLFRMIFRGKDDDGPGAGASQNSPRKGLIIFSVVSALVLIASVATSLRNLPRNSQIDFAVGTICGLAAVGGFAWLAWRILRFLEAEDEENTRRERDSNRSEPH